MLLLFCNSFYHLDRTSTGLSWRALRTSTLRCDRCRSALTVTLPKGSDVATDTADCSGGSAGGGGTCRYANDGECDEGTYCAAGTDTADCSGSGGGGGGGSNAWGGGGGEDPVLRADGNPQRVEGPFGNSDGKRLRLTVPTAGVAYAFKLEPEPTTRPR